MGRKTLTEAVSAGCRRPCSRGQRLLSSALSAGCEYSWTSYNESNVYGGVMSRSSMTLRACQAACTRDARCTGVDYSAHDRHAGRCFLILNDAAVNVAQTPGVTHYSLARNCEPYICVLLRRSRIFRPTTTPQFTVIAS